MNEFKNNRILIVDDEPKNRKIIRIRLEDDFDLKEASSGEEALALIEGFDPAVILLDIMMTGINGYEVTKKIRSIDKVSQAKIILVSGKALIEEKLEGYASGAEDYMTKPFNGKELAAKVNVFMKLYNLEKDMQRINNDLEKEIIERSEQLLKSERMAYVGMNAAEIVHNLKSPLSVIKGFVHLLQSKQPDLREAKKIDKAADKILITIKNILDSTSKDLKDEMTALNIDEIIKDEIDFITGLDADLRYQAEVNLELKTKHSILASNSHISQVVANLIKNSVEAMVNCEEKTLTITTRSDENYVWIQIEDSGEGISAENLEKIFQPLFTTKDGNNGKPVGNGLGLAYCKRMVETYQGELKVESKLNKGTRFTLNLPTHEPLANRKIA